MLLHCRHRRDKIEEQTAIHSRAERSSITPRPTGPTIVVAHILAYPTANLRGHSVEHVPDPPVVLSTVHVPVPIPRRGRQWRTTPAPRSAVTAAPTVVIHPAISHVSIAVSVPVPITSVPVIVPPHVVAVVPFPGRWSVIARASSRRPVRSWGAVAVRWDVCVYVCTRPTYRWWRRASWWSAAPRRRWWPTVPV